jgi:ABC-type ATPase with predicted acetyltransferase domain
MMGGHAGIEVWRCEKCGHVQAFCFKTNCKCCGSDEVTMVDVPRREAIRV